MMETLMKRADGIAREAQRKRIERIASTLREHGLAAEATTDSLIVRGRSILRKWLGDPLLRFAGHGQ